MEESHMDLSILTWILARPQLSAERIAFQMSGTRTVRVDNTFPAHVLQVKYLICKDSPC